MWKTLISLETDGYLVELVAYTKLGFCKTDDFRTGPRSPENG